MEFSLCKKLKITASAQLYYTYMFAGMILLISWCVYSVKKYLMI